MRKCNEDELNKNYLALRVRLENLVDVPRGENDPDEEEHSPKQPRNPGLRRVNLREASDRGEGHESVKNVIDLKAAILFLPIPTILSSGALPIVRRFTVTFLQIHLKTTAFPE